MKSLNKEQMKQISLGIAAEMTDQDRATLIGDNGKTGDARVLVFRIDPTGVRVASTNGDPAWEESDIASFAEFMVSEGIKLMGAPRKATKRPVVGPFTVAIETAAAIEADRREGESKGMVLDRWAVELKKI